MRILFVSPRYRPYVGGVEHVVGSVAERLASAGHDITVVAGEPGIDAPREEAINGVRVVRWPTFAPGGAYHVPRMRGALARLLEAEARRSDAVHIHSAHAVLPVYAGLLLRGKARLVFSPHYHGGGHTPLRDLLWRLAWRKSVAEVVEASAAVHAVSKVEADRLTAHFPASAGKTAVIPNGVDEDVLRHRWRGADSDYAVYAGRLEKYKNVEEAAGLARRLGLRLVAVGDGPLRGRLVRLPGVEVKPSMPRGDYLDVLAGARYAINLSSMEAFSVFIAEALAMGTPALVSEVVARALEAEVEEAVGPALLVRRAPVKTWGEVAPMYLELYRRV
ncbi:MAG: glycosyltransferase family 4 protein [Thermoproteus sp.]